MYIFQVNTTFSIIVRIADLTARYSVKCGDAEALLIKNIEFLDLIK